MTPWHLLSLSNYTSSPFIYSAAPFLPSPFTSSSKPLAPSSMSSPELYRSRSGSHSSSSEDDDDDDKGLKTPPQRTTSLPEVVRISVGAEEEDDWTLDLDEELLLDGLSKSKSQQKDVSTVPPPTPRLAPQPQPPRSLLAPSTLNITPIISAPPPPPEPQFTEEDRRGRSRWPRVLWRSEISEQDLQVLESYHRRAVGGELPVLKQGMRSAEVRKWSRGMERAGL